uniref:Predicted AAA-ATPase n=1 Tax=Candidatus Kentrum sp. LPFa TaxID=2126335 RepID=A0A450WPS1_9GAMM|nr:MAG: Predicted AAA-ATPase [Candidatus Kentron sp. LPFa]
MKFPYGISDFDSLITEKYYYVDRTVYIPLLEEAGKQLLFLRPRRFGKSLLLSMLENYYDLSKADRFEELFGHLAIGQSSTVEHSRYFVLKWDFSEVSPVGDGEEIKRNLYRYLNTRISDFSNDYPKRWAAPFQSTQRTPLLPFMACSGPRGRPVIRSISSLTNTTTSPTN